MFNSRRFLLLPALALAALASASCSNLATSSSASATGAWTWDYAGGDTGAAITHTYTLKQSGDALTRTFQDNYDETKVDIKDGKVKGDQVSFNVDRPFGGNVTLNFTFTGTIKGDTITGKASWTNGEQPTTSDWLAKRKP